MIHLGTSGYVYSHWREVFYPRGLPARRWLDHYSRIFSTVELNATFYRLPTPEAVDGWREQVPEGFMFACKGSRFLTHMKRLTDVGLGLERFFGLIHRLGPKLGPVLWQLPPQMKNPDPERLNHFLCHLPHDVQHAFEFRDAAWYHPEVLEVLDQWGAAVCEHDLCPEPPSFVTGGWRYLRFHGTTSRYSGLYGRKALHTVARDLDGWRRAGYTAWVYFNNDLQGHALLDAFELADLLGEPVRLPPEAPAPEEPPLTAAPAAPPGSP
jgi:uncharacterized protein YecE (DUF72 family)